MLEITDALIMISIKSSFRIKFSVLHNEKGEVSDCKVSPGFQTKFLDIGVLIRDGRRFITIRWRQKPAE
jgi:hypothetical protein